MAEVNSIAGDLLSQGRSSDDRNGIDFQRVIRRLSIGCQLITGLCAIRTPPNQAPQRIERLQPVRASRGRGSFSRMEELHNTLANDLARVGMN